MEETENWKIGSDKETVTDLSARGALGIKLLKCPLETGLRLGYSQGISVIVFWAWREKTWLVICRSSSTEQSILRKTVSFRMLTLYFCIDLHVTYKLGPRESLGLHISNYKRCVFLFKFRDRFKII
jgi:hypothetical protein